VTEDGNPSGESVSTEELRKAQQRLCEDVYQILRRLDKLERLISELERGNGRRADR
jgi:hypothetical protein